MALLFNPTGEAIVVQHGGLSTVFRAGEKKDIWDNYAAEHFVSRWGKYGLVKLSYGEKESKIFDDFDEYEHAQKILGVTKLLETLQSTAYNFDTYDEACDSKRSPERRQLGQQAISLKKRIADITKSLEKLEAFSARKTPQQKAAILRKRAQELEAEAAILVPKKESNGDNTAKSA